MAEHNNYGVDFINATREIKRLCPGSKISGGVSNLAFSFRGQRARAPRVPLRVLVPRVQGGHGHGHRQRRAGREDVYEKIDKELLDYVEDVLLNKCSNAHGAHARVRGDARPKVQAHGARKKGAEAGAAAGGGKADAKAWREPTRRQAPGARARQGHRRVLHRRHGGVPRRRRLPGAASDHRGPAHGRHERRRRLVRRRERCSCRRSSSPRA